MPMQTVVAIFTGREVIMNIEDVEIGCAAYFPKPQSFFKEIPSPFADNGVYVKVWRHNGLVVMASVAEYNNTEWLHISFSRKNRMPDYNDIQIVKRNFIGDDKKAIMVFPEWKNHVNICEHCLHLFYSADNPLPDFSGGTGSI